MLQKLNDCKKIKILLKSVKSDKGLFYTLQRFLEDPILWKVRIENVWHIRNPYMLPF